MTVFFQYPEYWGVSRPYENVVENDFDEFKQNGLNLAFKVGGSTHVYNSVVNSMKNAGFEMISKYAFYK